MGPRSIKTGAYCLECLTFDCEHFRPVPKLPPRLLAKQVAVLRRLSSGKSNKVIAYELGLGYYTTKVYVSQILDLLGFESRLQAALWAIAHQLTETGETKA